MDPPPRERLLEEQVVLLQTEVNALQETVAHLLQVQVQQQEAAQGGTKQDSSTIPPATKRSRYACISAKILLQFQPSIDPLDIPYEQIAWWKDIFSYIQPNDYEKIYLRRLCNMFKASLKPPPKGGFTEFPHPNHTSIDSLMNRLNALHEEDERSFPRVTTAPTFLYIKAGIYEIEGHYVKIKYAINIVGAGQGKTTLYGGIQIEGNEKQGKRVGLSLMTVRNLSGNGLYCEGQHKRKLSFICQSMTFNLCHRHGVSASNIKGRLINCGITQCKESGIYCGGVSLIELAGSQTNVCGNVTCGYSGYYGLQTSGNKSRMHLLSPLTKESVSTDNHIAKNYGGGDKIQTVNTFEPL